MFIILLTNKEVIPKGFVRFFGKIAEISDKGTNIHLIVGNHDMWVKNYFTEVHCYITT